MAGYSQTPLYKKLGIQPGTKLHVASPPEGYLSWLEPLPAGVKLSARLSKTTEVAHLFTCKRAELAAALSRYRKNLNPAAALWVSWPKKSSKEPTDLTEDAIRELALPLGFVDVKVCAVSEVWSGLKLVVRRELRG